jgi:prepilin-type N-terminal cleavage/methylation domain-containing protein
MVIGDEDGFTLTELLAALLVGLVVLLAAYGLLDHAARSRKATSERVEAAATGRLAMERVTQALRSQLCPDDATPALIQGDGDAVTFYGSLGPEPTQSGRLDLQKRRVRFVPAAPGADRGRLVEDVYPGTYVPATKTWTFPATPVTRVIAREIGRSAPGAPIFRYYRYDPADAPAMLELATPLDETGLARTVQIAVAFDAHPDGPADPRRRTVLADRVLARTADPTDPQRSPRCA